MYGKSLKTSIRTPRGFPDLEAENLRSMEQMISVFSKTLELYGFDPIQQPIIDYSSSLGKFLPDQDCPNQGVFSFQDDDEQWLSLRYDLTAPLARFLAENYDRLPKPYRTYRFGPVFRNEKAGFGRFRQFMQFDADIAGAANVAADAEIIMIMIRLLQNLGLHPNDYLIRINHRKLLDGFLESIGLEDKPEMAEKRLIVLRALDKIDRLGSDGVAALLGKGRWDGSNTGEGDFTKGAELGNDAISQILSFISKKMTISEFLSRINENTNCNPKSKQALQDLEKMCIILQGSEALFERIVIDTSVVRGLEYYTGPVYEVELLNTTLENNSKSLRCGSIGGGGRYDQLLTRFNKAPLPCTGFSIGISRFVAALQSLEKLPPTKVPGPVIVLLMEKDPISISRQQKLVSDLHRAGIRAELYSGEGSMKTQMKYADRRGSPCVIIQGANELSRGEVEIKDLIRGMNLTHEIHDNREWRTGNSAQVSVPESALVETVGRILQQQTNNS